MTNLQAFNLFALLAKFAAFGYSLGVLVSINTSITVWLFWVGLQVCVFAGEICRLKHIQHENTVDNLKK